MTWIQIFILILLVHFCADFALQTHEQANGKGEGSSFWNKWLAYHVGVYTLIWGVAFWMLPVVPELNHVTGWVVFMLFIGIPHYITDYITSRIGKPFWKAQDFHNGFVVVGFDQVVHYLCLIYVLSKTIIIQ